MQAHGNWDVSILKHSISASQQNITQLPPYWTVKFRLTGCQKLTAFSSPMYLSFCGLFSPFYMSGSTGTIKAALKHSDILWVRISRALTCKLSAHLFFSLVQKICCCLNFFSHLNCASIKSFLCTFLMYWMRKMFDGKGNCWVKCQKM